MDANTIIDGLLEHYRQQTFLSKGSFQVKPEQKLWSRLSKAMKGYWSASRHEDSVATGTPDVSWGARKVNGWLELKVIKGWPLDDKKVAPIDVRSAQRVFLINRSKHGGHCGVFVYVEKTEEYFLFMKTIDFKSLNKTYTRLDWEKQCAIHTSDLPEPTRLLDVLTGIRRYGEL